MTASSAVSREVAPNLTTGGRKRLWMIHRRMLFLEQRIAERGDPKASGYDKGELEAIRWLLEMADLPEPVGEGPARRLTCPREAVQEAQAASAAYRTATETLP